MIDNDDDVKELSIITVREQFKDGRCLLYPVEHSSPSHSSTNSPTSSHTVTPGHQAKMWNINQSINGTACCHSDYHINYNITNERLKARDDYKQDDKQQYNDNNNLYSHNKMMSSRSLLISIMSFLLLVSITGPVLCDSLPSHSTSSSVTFPYASAATFPEMTGSVNNNTPQGASSLSFPSSSPSSSLPSPSSSPLSVISLPTPSTQNVILNRRTTVGDLLALSASRQAPTVINYSQFCGAPPTVPNAQSNLMRNQKHHVFAYGTPATYACDPGFRPVLDTPHINTTRCTYPPTLSTGSASNVIFPDSAIHESLRSGRAKNSKRLLEIDEEPDANHASQNRVTSGSQFNDRHKSGRSEDFVYDTSSEPFLSGRNSDLETNDPEVLEHRKQKLENSVRSGQRPEWYPAVTLRCERVTCPDPGEVEHATRKLSPEGFVHNSNVFYECNPGYATNNVPILSCRQDGTWNRPRPKCDLKQCPTLSPIDNGRILYDNDRKIDSNAEYHCNPGYRLNAPTIHRQCQSNQEWTISEVLNFIPNASGPEVNDPFRCIPVECPAPVRPHSGVRILNPKKNKKYLPGDVVIYSCSAVKARATAKCGDDGTWSRDPPDCPQMASKCPTLPHFPHGTVDIRENRAEISCFEGYELVGSQSITCLKNNTWSDDIPNCVLKAIKGNSLELGSNGTSAEDSDVNAEVKISQPSRTMTIILLVFFVVFLIFGSLGTIFFCRWRQNKIQRQRWRQYFGDYRHRQSKTNIVMNRTDHMAVARSSMASSKVGSRRPRGGSNSTSTQAFLQSSFSSADEHNADNRSVQTGAGTLTSEHARTMSTFADDCTTTCADDDFDDYEEAPNEQENLYITSATMLAGNDSLEVKTPEPMIQLSTPETQTKQPHGPTEPRPSSVLLDPLYTNYAGPSTSGAIISNGVGGNRPIPAPRVLGPKPSPAVPVTDL